MQVILTLDDENGMMFNHRRQSRDRIMLKRLVALTEGRRLFMSPYTAGLFPAGLPTGAVATSNFLAQADTEDICFVEDASLLPIRNAITVLYVFRWNRLYPADRRLDIDLSGWQKEVVDEFPGSSHDTITLERYRPPHTERRQRNDP